MPLQRLLWLLCLLVCVLAPLVSFADPSYTLIDLGPVTALGLDDAGVIVGSTYTPAQQAAVLHPFMQDLTTLGGRADAVRRGKVVGYTQFGDPAVMLTSHAFRWTATGGLEDLGTAGGSELFSAATSLMPSGVVVGYADDPTTHDSRPCFWRTDTLHFLPTLGGPAGFADAVNRWGLIVGQSQTTTGEYHATLWVMSMPFDLDTTGGAWSIARDINGEGIVVGDASFPTGSHAFRWTRWAGMHDLGTLPGDLTSVATGVNTNDIIVGASTSAGTEDTYPISQAVRWHHRRVQPLAMLVEAPDWTLEWASAINTAGAIIGQGHLAGEAHAFLLRPIPTDRKTRLVQARPH